MDQGDVVLDRRRVSRGSYVSKFIHCEKCAGAIREMLSKVPSEDMSVVEAEPGHVFAGKLWHRVRGEEYMTLARRLRGIDLCHVIAFVCICGNKDVVLVRVFPGGLECKTLLAK